ncbi:MAG: RsmG family class I SAM-dependent methyltransferase [Actinomycetota bacterium]|nr:RsmG family class I SAM-dependent methyltransferase [Actinomycetota bacterium]
MFHGKHSDGRLAAAARRAGTDLTPEQREQLNEFARWLGTEAVDAGGIGPDEGSRLVDRHVADSIVFAAAWDQTPAGILDVGSGVGLPGIPLAITHPDSDVTLLDRSGERCRLARRAVRVLGLENVSVEQADVSQMVERWDVITFRASLQPIAALEAGVPLLSDRGCAVVGMSRTAEPEIPSIPPPGTTLDLLRIDPGVLDSPAWLLRMTLTDPRTLDSDPSS